MEAVKTARWNLASLMIATAGCGPLIVPGNDTDGETDTASSTTEVTSSPTTDPSGPSTDPTAPTTDPTSGQCPEVPCGPGYYCASGSCVPYYYCGDNCCEDGPCCDYYDGRGYCCYYDGGCWGYCSSHADCAGGEYCNGYGCYPAQMLPACGGELTPVPVTTIPMSGNVLSLAFVDGDGDAAREMVVAHTAGATLVPGGGGPAVDLPVPQQSQVDDIGVGDLDGDGDEDIALAVSGATSGLLLLYNDAGVFGLGVSPPSVVQQVEIADVDGDGAGDLVILGDLGGPSPEVAIRAGLGGGMFDAPYVHSVSGEIYDFVLAPLLSSQRRDLLVAGASEMLAYYSGPFDGTSDAFFVGTGLLRASIDGGDLDADGDGDIVRITNKSDQTLIEVWPRDPDGNYFTVSPPQRVGGDFDQLAVGDVDGDGRADAVLAGPSGTLAVVPGTSSDFTVPILCVTDAVFGGSGPPVLGDFDGDGRQDIARGDGPAVQLFMSPQ
jgi:hypothetical protein